MKRTYQYRLYPRRAERRALDLLLEQSREVYNAALAQCKGAYETAGKHQTGINQWSYFRDWRNTYADLILNATSVQQILRRLDKAYSAFFRRIKAGEKEPGHPRFKGRNRFNSLEYTYSDGVKLVYDEAFDRFVLYVQNVGNIKVKAHRFLPDGAAIKHVVLKRKATGWYVCLMLDMPDVDVCPNGLPAVGGDVGLLRLLTLSDGTQIDNPRWLRDALAELRRAQRRLARRVKGSQRRRNARVLTAKLHEHVANVRRDFWHKVTTWLVNTYGLIALEKLNLAFMTRNSHLSLSAHDAGLGIFRQLLDSKAENAGCHVTLVAPAYTSQVCSGCGAIVEKVLSVRVHVCPDCFLELDRDINAARNILSLALKSAWIGPSAVNVAAVQGKRRLRSCRLQATE